MNKNLYHEKNSDFLSGKKIFTEQDNCHILRVNA
jgi:hypothetical protein